MNTKNIILDYTMQEYIKRLKNKSEPCKIFADIIEKSLLEDISKEKLDEILFELKEQFNLNLVNFQECEEAENIIFSILTIKKHISKN